MLTFYLLVIWICLALYNEVREGLQQFVLDLLAVIIIPLSWIYRCLKRIKK